MPEAATVHVDRQGLGVLTETQCLALLDSTRLGRIALTDRAMPIILPVGFARLDNDLIFRVGQGALSRAARMGQVVCFEVDWTDDRFENAWSVAAIGQLSTLDQPARLRRAQGLDLIPWSSQCDEYVQLTPQLISGRCK
jgi:nitroimidazol reductase NimA-like FMN-containing flavoprotein (pyridoxamine 5'-phosphate oxidase superfamily)